MMLGRDVFVAFVFDEGAEDVNVYLPKGSDWYLNDTCYSGGETVQLTIPCASKMPYFVRSGCILPTDEAPYGFKTDGKIIFTVYPIKNGSFESEFFYDDGVSFEYQNNNCVHLNFKVCCDEHTVSVSFENTGETAFEPEIRLCSADERKLIVK